MEVGCLLHAEKRMTERETEALIFKGGVQSPDWLAADWLEEPICSSCDNSDRSFIELALRAS